MWLTMAAVVVPHQAHHPIDAAVYVGRPEPENATSLYLRADRSCAAKTYTHLALYDYVVLLIQLPLRWINY